MKKALVCGISGQDGAYLTRLLLDRGTTVVGTSRDAHRPLKRLRALGIRERVQVRTLDLRDSREVMATIDEIAPDEIYNLAGQSSVGLSFEEPLVTLQSIAIGTLNLLEAIRLLGAPSRLFHASSGECFGDTGGVPADETWPFRPGSPYAVAKAAAHWMVTSHRESYGLFSCSGILFAHESPLRPETFVTQKIVRAACRIAAGSDETLSLGNTSVQRDWGWAPEYVEAMARMLEQDEAEDFVIATGEAHALQEFVEETFRQLDLDWRRHVATDPSLLRPSDIPALVGDASKAQARLGWRARVRMAGVVRRMIDAEQARTEDQ